MSQFTVYEDGIVGEPGESSRVIDTVVLFIVGEGLFDPPEKFLNDIENLKSEIIEKHTFGEEGFFIFTSELVEAVLNRAYPYLVQNSLDNNLEIELARTETMSDDDLPLVIYEITATRQDEEKPIPLEGDEASISENPFPRPPGIDAPDIPFPVGTPGDGVGPLFGGRPFDPLAPLSRDLRPLTPRTPEEARIEELKPLQKDNSPIQEGGKDDFERGYNYEAPQPLGEAPTPRETIADERAREDEPMGATPTEAPPETEPIDTSPSEDDADDGSDILERILAAIIDQGDRTRQTLADTAYAVDLLLIDVIESIDEIIPGFENVLNENLDRVDALSETTLDDIKIMLDDIYEKAAEQSDALADGTQDIIDGIFDEIVEIANDPIQALEEAFLGIGELLNDAIAHTGRIIADGFKASTDAILFMADEYKKGVTNTLDFLTAGMSMDNEQIEIWICEFFQMIKRIKNECSVFSGEVK